MRPEPGRGADRGLGAAAAAWASTRHVRAGPARVRYRDAGSGPVVVLVHGLGMSSDYWSRNAPVLAAAGFRVIAPDLPGFGASADQEPVVEIREQAAALSALAEALELPAATWVGHSLSCQTVIELAARRPERVAALVLAAPTGDGGARRMVLEAWRLLLDAPRESLSLLTTAFHAYVRTGPVRFLRTWRAGSMHDPLPLLPRIAVPVLVVVGDDDPVVPLRFAREVAHRLPRGDLAVLPGASHSTFFDAPDAFNARVIHFLRSL